MDVVNAALGFFGIVMGVRALSKGANRLSGAMGYSSGGRRVVVIRGVKTTIVPRSATLAEAPLSSQGARTGTVAGSMRLTMRGVTSLDQRLASIIKGVEEAKTDPTIVAWARRVTSQRGRDGQWLAAEKDTRAEVDLIHQAVRQRTRYTSDPRGVDLYSDPRKTLAMRAGDCDEQAAVACAALKAVGIPCALKVIAEKGSPGGQPTHIFALAGSDKSSRPRSWIPIDPTVPNRPPWEAPPSMVREAWIYETE
jgi:transglutaminase-like putative cysteine protease